MALYDVINEITQKQVTKTETGDTRVYGVMVGKVAKNYDKDMPGRVCVIIPTRDDKANELKWARHVQPSSGKKWGHYFLPEQDDQVLLAFEGGNIEKPYIIGCLPKDNDTFLTKSVDEHNQIKRIVTKHGSSITFYDNNTDENGAKDKITIQTAGEAHTFLMDNENKKINLTDKEKLNYITMDTGEGKLDIKIKSKVTIQVGESIKIILNGEAGTIKIETGELNTQASRKFQVKTDGMLTTEGATVKAKASSVYKIESSGMVNVSGSPIKIG